MNTSQNSFYSLKYINMEILLIGLCVNVLTWIATKFNISGTYIAIGLSLIGGALYYVSINFFPTEAKQILVVLAGIYATSQVVYNVLSKTGILDKINGTKIQ